MAKKRSKHARTARKSSSGKNLTKNKSRQYTNGFARWNIFRAAFSEYLREENIDLRDYCSLSYNEAARLLYAKLAPETPVKAIPHAIHSLFKKHIRRRKGISAEYRERFYFFDAPFEFQLPKYAGLRIGFEYGGEAAFQYEGDASGFAEWYTSSGFGAYCRQNYNDSPLALFVLQPGSDECWAVYEVEVDTLHKGSSIGREKEVKQRAGDVGRVSGVVLVVPSPEGNLKGFSSEDLGKAVELEKEKARVLELELIKGLMEEMKAGRITAAEFKELVNVIKGTK